MLPPLSIAKVSQYHIQIGARCSTKDVCVFATHAVTVLGLKRLGEMQNRMS